jgi:RNA polymerase sigma factor (sigma-70 family)
MIRDSNPCHPTAHGPATTIRAFQVTEQPPSFDTLLRPHLSRLYRLAYRLTGSVADAEDLLQDVLVKLYERRNELESIDSLDVWAGRVLYNRFVDQTRRYARRRMVSLTERADLEPSTADAMPESAAVDIRRVWAAVERLSAEQREVLLLHDAEGYKFIEIQQVTGVPVGTLKSRLHRARARLRELLDGGGTF